VSRTPDDLTSTLDEIRERYRASFTTLPGFSVTPMGTEWTHVNSADDVPLLVAAVEAALKLADEWEADSLIIDPEIALREAITRELTGTPGNE
jgi:hypothetical protein